MFQGPSLYMFCDMQICMFQCFKVPPISMSCDKAVPEPELSFAIVFVHVDAGYQQGRPGHCAVENQQDEKMTDCHKKNLKRHSVRENHLKLRTTVSTQLSDMPVIMFGVSCKCQQR